MIRFTLLGLALLVTGCGAQAGDAVGPSSDAPGPQLPTTAVVVCEQAGARVLTPQVAARRDGVHFELRNESGERRLLSVRSPDSGQGEGFTPGTHARVWPYPPGTVTVSCGDPAAGTDDRGYPLEIVDEDGLWVSTTLDCERLTSTTFDWLADSAGLRGEPAEVVRRADEAELEEGDVVEPAGYPDAPGTASVRVLREGRAVMLVELFPTGEGGWLVSTITRCDES